jgi:hypothetical protein
MSSEGKTTRVGSLDVIWARTNHPVFAAGYLLTKGRTSILYSGDTTTTEALWSLGNLAEALAQKTGHLTPGMLIKELDKLDKPEVPVKIFHMKPQYLEEISAELASCQRHCRILDGNERFVF